ncbi:unnamed protein product [Penicillium pancosmium]
MPPSAVNSLINETSQTTKDLLPRHKSDVWNFEVFRQLVPLVARYHSRRHPRVQLPSPALPPSKAPVATAEKARQLIARYIHADPTSVPFMRDTTERLNSLIRGIKFTPGDNVVVLDSEHPNHAYGWMALREAGLEVRQVLTIPE